MNYHPFELKIEDLEALSEEFEILSEDASLTIGGNFPTATTLAVGEEGGDLTTLALGEEGGDLTTLALGEEGGCFPLFTTLACHETGC